MVLKRWDLGMEWAKVEMCVCVGRGRAWSGRVEMCGGRGRAWCGMVEMCACVRGGDMKWEG